MVTVQPVPRVSVFCTMEVAINSVPAGPETVVLPVPEMLPTFLTPWEISSPVAVLLLTMSNERLVTVSVNGSAVPPAWKVPPFMNKFAPVSTVTGVPVQRLNCTVPVPSLSRVPFQNVRPEPATIHNPFASSGVPTLWTTEKPEEPPDASSLMIRLPLMLPSTLPMKVQLLSLSVKPVDCGRSFEGLAAVLSCVSLSVPVPMSMIPLPVASGPGLAEAISTSPLPTLLITRMPL